MDCSVEFLDNTKGHFEPGENLHGEVTLKLRKAKKIYSIRAEIFGDAECWFQIDRNATQVNVTTNRAKINHLSETIHIIKESGDGQIELETGEHKFDFFYLLPSNLPSSFKCTNGSIKYLIQIVVEKTRVKELSYKFPFKVIRPLNLNNESVVQRVPLMEETYQNMIYLSASIPSSGYVPGQIINVSIRVNNQSKTHIKEMQISLKKIINLRSANTDIVTRNIVVSELAVAGDPVPFSIAQSFEKTLVVPPLEPSILNCDIIQVKYEVRVKAKIGGLIRSPKCKIPIIIGSIQSDDAPPMYEQYIREIENNLVGK